MIRTLMLLLVSLLGLMADGQCHYALADEDLDSRLDKVILKGIEGLQTKDEFESALSICRRYIDTYKDVPAKKDRVTLAYVWQSKIAREMGNKYSNDIIPDIKSRWQKDRSNPDLNRELGLLYKAVEKMTEARIYLESAARLDSSDLSTWEALIDLNEKYGTREQKIYAYQGCLKVDTTNALYWTRSGVEYLGIGDTTAAENSFERAVKIDPQQTLAHQNLAILKQHRKDWIGAQSHYNIVLHNEPTNTVAQSGLEITQAYVQQEEAAKKTLREARTALQSADQKQWGVAEEKFKDVLKINPDNPEATSGYYKARKKLYNYWLSKGNKDAENPDSLKIAIISFTKAAEYADSRQDREKFFEKYSEAVIRFDKRVETLRALQLAEEALGKGDFNKAIEEITKAVILDTTVVLRVQPLKEVAEMEQKYKLGIDAYNQNDNETALMHFKYILDHNPNFKEVKMYCEEVRRAILIQTVKAELTKFWIAILPWVRIFLLGVTIVVLIRSRKILLKHFHNLVQRLSRVPNKWWIVIGVLAAISILGICVIVFWTSLFPSFKRAVALLNANQGVLEFAGLIIIASGGVRHWIKTSKSKTAPNWMKP